MLSLAQSARRVGDLGNPLPDVYDVFKRERIALRRGRTSLVVAGPGVGKTTLALDWVRRLRVPTLYVCIDTAEQDAAARAVAMATGLPLAEVEGMVEEFTEDLTREFPKVKWYFGLSPTVEEIELELKAFGEAFGAYPELIVVDNLTSIDMESELNFTAVRDTMVKLNNMAILTGAHVMALAHATGEYENGDKPIPLGGIEFKAGKVADLCLTLTRDDSELRVAAVKTRGGSADASGKTPVPLYTDLARMAISEKFPRDRG